MTDVNSAAEYTGPSFDSGSGETLPVGDQNGQVQEDELSLASPFLSKIPASDRAVVGRYIKDWDAGVTKRFQDYSGRLKPYEALGPVDELIKYRNFAQNFRQNPEMMFKLMWEGLQEQYGDNFQTELARILEIEAQEQAMSDQQFYDGENGDQPQYEQPDPNEVFQQNVLQELNELREWRTNFEQSQEDAEGQAQLDGVIDQMHNRYGQFDDNFILLELSRHGNVEQAIQAWHQMLGQYSSPQQPQRSAPKIMGGQGGVPSGQVNAEQLRGKDRRNLVANMLANLEE